ncbi:serine/threonine-protein kinase DDB_G0283821-like isoform X3 [Dysidea avara]|uniref:serine/threonine-protein kinase DDB_G0283821-like isoform X3 n=1 Tax=Dysidea avara TaxID=196820 RepID=UPI00332CB68D
MAGQSASFVAVMELTNVEETKIEIGHGTFAKVFEARYFGSVCAAKNLRSNVSLKLGIKPVTKNNYLNKCREWANLRHPKIVQFIGYYNSPASTVPSVLLMEKMHMNLTTLLHDHSKLPAATKLSILLDVAQGVKYLHCLKKFPIVHGNLTSDNILLNTQLQAKISDVGISHFFRTVMSSMTDLTVFSPPEYSLPPNSLETSVDIFSYGTVIVHIDTRSLPEPLPVQQPHTTRKVMYQPCIDKMTLNLKPLVTSCLNRTPRNRPKIDIVLKEIEPMAKRFSHVSKTILAWKAEHESLFQEKRKLEEEIKSMEKQLSEANSTREVALKEQTEQYDQLKEEHGQLKEELGRVDGDCVQELCQLKEEHSQLKKEFKQINGERDQLKEKLGQMQEKHDKCLEGLDQTNEEHSTIKEIPGKNKAMAKLELVSPTNPSNLCSEVDGEKERMSKLEKCLESKTNELKLVSNQMEQQINELKEQVTLLTKELEQTKQERYQFKHQMQQLQEQIVKDDTHPTQHENDNTQPIKQGQDNSDNRGSMTGNDSKQDFSGDQDDPTENKQGKNYSGDQNSATGNKQEQGNTGSEAEEPISNTSATEGKSSQEGKTAPGVESLPSGKPPPGDRLLPEVRPPLEGPDVNPTLEGEKLPLADKPFVGVQDFVPSDGLASKVTKLKGKDEQLKLERDQTEQQSVLDNLTGNEDGNNATISQDHEVKNRQENESTVDKDHMTENQPGESNIGDQDGSQNNTGDQTNIQRSMTGNKPGNYHTESQNTMTGNEPSQVITANQNTTTGNEPGQDNTEDQGTTKPGQGNYTGSQDHTAGNQPKNGNAKNNDITTKNESENDKLNGGKKPQEEKPPPGSTPPLVNKEKAKDKQPRESLNYSFSDGLGPKVIGFNNLGNTCFFNSMLQSIHQTPRLHYVMARKNKSYVIPGTEMDYLEVPVTGSVTSQLHNFFSRVSRENWSISPSNLLHSLGIINKRFGRGTQEDSHEVMRLLLSAIREEEIHCIKEQIKSRFIGRSRVAPLDGETKLDMKSCLSKASKGVCEVDQLIGTLLVTTTICHHCCSRMADKEKKILYGLYAVVVHGGSLHGGHYTANVRRRPPVHEQTPKGDSWKYDEGAAYQGDWYYTSDSHVSSPSTFSSVERSQAYLLFYELLPIN